MVLSARQRHYLYIKRIFDLAICLMLLPFAAPMMLIIAVLIKLDSPGPPFYIQKRIGKDGRIFRIYKFRTLQLGADTTENRKYMQAFVAGQIESDDMRHGQPVFKPFQEEQVTRVGRILRRTSLDELPQLFNVLSGSMSWIGPRPNVPWEVEKYNLWHYTRLDILPGITGLAQVYGRSSISFDEIVRYDIRYVMNQCFKLDMEIVWLTVRSVLSGHGAG